MVSGKTNYFDEGMHDLQQTKFPPPSHTHTFIPYSAVQICFKCSSTL